MSEHQVCVCRMEWRDERGQQYLASDPDPECPIHGGLHEEPDYSVGDGSLPVELVPRVWTGAVVGEIVAKAQGLSAQRFNEYLDTGSNPVVD